MLMEELRTWPDVTERPMFGFQSFYRGKTIFAALPKTRSISGNALIFKIPTITPKIARELRDKIASTTPGHRWFSAELSGEDDIREALRCLAIAYDCAKPQPAKGKSRDRR
jgi:hypothetical protein